MQFFLSNAIFRLLRFEKNLVNHFAKNEKLLPAQKTNSYFFSMLALAVFLVSCPAAGKLNRYYDPNPIPADLQKDGYTLLVLKQNRGGFRGIQNRGVKKLMRRHYGSAFEMVSAEDLKSTKYDDANKYRYIIGRDFNSGIVVTNQQSMKVMGVGGGTMTTHREYHEETIYDERQTKPFLLSAIPVPAIHWG